MAFLAQMSMESISQRKYHFAVSAGWVVACFFLRLSNALLRKTMHCRVCNGVISLAAELLPGVLVGVLPAALGSFLHGRYVAP